MRESAIKGNSQRSVRWYQDQIRKLGMGLRNINPQRVMTSGLGTGLNGVKIGQMFMYYYHPKHEERLPHWDAFPLVIPFKLNDDGFHGVNFHYLNPNDRMAFLKTIMLIQKSGGGVSWEVLKAHAGTFAEHCVKRYLYSHVKNQYFQKIDPEDWKTTIMLPVERFMKQTKYSAYL
jgi:hypothetical protein